ncbi:ABC transporter substrate-binding protein [Polymorphospora rubra]|uniref:Sugar ABC transporter substrate-binding protein n=1 Tax=Polymorphospora rubra TaxID=338584 RepID=A0A810N2T2_9ACTN|nr:ABC transporter substrate-binding protein [Polymorphospora rubra]BCJ66509.1 sugar ABC transporter substrate-binding protein [Polymorphospora rubra]
MSPLLALVLFTAVGLTGCTDDRTVDGDGRIELSVFWWGGERRAELTEQALRLYSSRHPEVTFRVTWQGETGYYERLATQAAAGNVADLFQIDDDYLTEYVDSRIVLDLTAYAASGALDLSQFPRGLAQYGQVGGRTVAVAAAANTPGMVYNRSLLNRLGLAEPRIGMTYDELIRWASQVTRESGGQTAGTMDASADYRALWLWLRTQGKELYQGREIGFTESDVTRWFELWQSARASRATPSAAVIQQANGGEPARQLVVTRQAATSFAWSNELTELQRYTKDDLAVVAYPGDPKGQWTQASMYWAAFRGTRHADTVVDVINFLVNDPEAGAILGTERGLSPNARIREAVNATLVDEKMKRTVAFEARMAEHFGPAPAPPPKGHARIRALLVTHAESVQFGRATPRAAAYDFVAEARAALAT